MFFGDVSGDTSREMMGEVSPETSPKNTMIQDMINSEIIQYSGQRKCDLKSENAVGYVKLFNLFQIP